MGRKDKNESMEDWSSNKQKKKKIFREKKKESKSRSKNRKEGRDSKEDRHNSELDLSSLSEALNFDKADTKGNMEKRRNSMPTPTGEKVSTKPRQKTV